jgi:DSF synthase
MELLNHKNCRLFTEAGNLSQVTAYYEQGRNILWVMMHGHPRPCFNPELLRESELLKAAVKKSGIKVDFWVTGSSVPQLYNVGGDLSYFAQSIRKGERAALREYAHACIDAVQSTMAGFDCGAVTIAMIEGTAMGGGFEAALAHDYVLAQKDAKMGFPEIAFNLYPGMGAYSLTARKSNRAVAEELISTGEAHTGDWHHQAGLVDHVFEAGTAFATTRTFIDTLRPKLNGIKAMLRTRQRVFPLDRAELMEITDDWAESAFRIEEKDLAYMERLVMLQNRRVGKSPALAAA